MIAVSILSSGLNWLGSFRMDFHSTWRQTAHTFPGDFHINQEIKKTREGTGTEINSFPDSKIYEAFI